VIELQWTSAKPTEPGNYKTRWPDGSNVNDVIVRRRGRGLQVVCVTFSDIVPMSRLADHELEWAKVQ